RGAAERGVLDRAVQRRSTRGGRAELGGIVGAPAVDGGTPALAHDGAAAVAPGRDLRARAAAARADDDAGGTGLPADADATRAGRPGIRARGAIGAGPVATPAAQRTQGKTLSAAEDRAGGGAAIGTVRPSAAARRLRDGYDRRVRDQAGTARRGEEEERGDVLH